jgi:fatty aldehyde-generating acyl-ACP reductase
LFAIVDVCAFKLNQFHLLAFMKKFAFLVHLRENYRNDLARLSTPLGWVPDSFYSFLLRNRPIKPFIWSDVTLTPGVSEAEGHIIMLPYSGQQILEQQKLMSPLLKDAMKLARSKGAEVLGLGALTSPISLGGKLLANNPTIAITNGNAFTAVITYERLSSLIESSNKCRPVVALVGATGSVGTLVCMQLAEQNPENEYILVARNERRLKDLSVKMKMSNRDVNTCISLDINSIKRADIVVLLTTASECLLQANHLKKGAIVLDDTQPRNTHPDILTIRPDVTIIDGGLVAVDHLKCSKGGIGLPQGLSYACLAETMLLAKADHEGDFSIGNPTLDQAYYIKGIAQQFKSLGFGVAPDYSFGKLINPADSFNQKLAPAYKSILE